MTNSRLTLTYLSFYNNDQKSKFSQQYCELLPVVEHTDDHLVSISRNTTKTTLGISKNRKNIMSTSSINIHASA